MTKCVHRRAVFHAVGLAIAVAAFSLAPHDVARAEEVALPKDVPAGTKIVVADQNEKLQTLMRASGEQGKLSFEANYANFAGGPQILEAFRAGAVDLATVGNAAPIQAQAAGEDLPIVAAITQTSADYTFAVRPGLAINTLEELKGKKIAYAEGSGRQPFVLFALKLAGLSRDDVELVRLRVPDFQDAIRTGQVDAAPLIEPHLSRYLAEFKDASVISPAQHDRLPRALSYLYASRVALDDPAKAPAVRDFVAHWIAANRWSKQNPDAWVDAYYVKAQKLTKAEGDAIVKAEGEDGFPLLSSVVGRQQELADLIFDAGDLPERLDASKEFDLRFDEVIAASNSSN
ncbi:ABC transporter substrate-binding protein [Phyllobacterium chamaecytisi]|uniref:ABC transporter substrate-binding protein n=1 Tax=Phyllobacterium chamaecytisi TaxID=2876082 RepID=UPI001CC9690C|nr:ABC transporter substrate-binding protein [Phyllobacterium sp. KW56]MBZ9605491.1 ABC transporter substrate-binding protein [Phyllobacterium sp. KW56]